MSSLLNPNTAFEQTATAFIKLHQDQLRVIQEKIQAAIANQHFNTTIYPDDFNGDGTTTEQWSAILSAYGYVAKSQHVKNDYTDYHVLTIAWTNYKGEWSLCTITKTIF